MNLLINKYQDTEIFILYQNKYKNLIPEVQKDLYQILQLKVDAYNIDIENFEFLSNTDNSLYIASNSRDILCTYSKSNIIIGNIIQCTILFFFSKKVQEIHCTYFDGIFTILYQYINIVVALLVIFPVYLYPSPYINYQKITYCFLGFLNGAFTGRLLRDLLELDQERYNFYHHHYQPRAAELFIINQSSVVIGMLILVLSVITGFIICAYSIVGTLWYFIFLLAYYTVALSPMLIKFYYYRYSNYHYKSHYTW